MAKKAQQKKTTGKSATSKSAAAKSKTTKLKKTAVAKAKQTATKEKKTITKAAPKTTRRKTKVVKEVKSEKTAVKKAKIKGYSKKDLEMFKKVIMAKREEIIEQLQNLKDQMMDPSTGQYVNESSPYSLHMAEQGTDAQEREKLYLWAQRENKFLGYLEEALQRIENGTYGLCIECIDEPKYLCPTCPLIPKERLMAVPHTQMCVQIKMAQKK
ncbi:MAG: conjugal transfer protein TraR [Melioribacteraceae bacterium]|nr:conjugal transfer protein TraR [Melioribacteraceae bacterium]